MTTTPGGGNYYSDIEAYTHQYPFGMPQPGRTYDGSSLAYRYGFNGMETDPEVKGEFGNHYTTYFRQYDPRVGRWWSNDPVVHSWESPYVAFHDNPAYFSDPLGNDPPETPCEGCISTQEPFTSDDSKQWFTGVDGKWHRIKPLVQQEAPRAPSTGSLPATTSTSGTVSGGARQSSSATSYSTATSYWKPSTYGGGGSSTGSVGQQLGGTTTEGGLNKPQIGFGWKLLLNLSYPMQYGGIDMSLGFLSSSKVVLSDVLLHPESTAGNLKYTTYEDRGYVLYDIWGDPVEGNFDYYMHYVNFYGAAFGILSAETRTATSQEGQGVLKTMASSSDEATSTTVNAADDIGVSLVDDLVQAQKVDLMGGTNGTPGYTNYDLSAGSGGIADDVVNFGRHFPANSVGEIVVNNPQAHFLQHVENSLQSGGTITVRGTMSNKYFNKIYNGKADGLSNFTVISKVTDVPSPGYLQTGGDPIIGKINEIVLRKR